MIRRVAVTGLAGLGLVACRGERPLPEVGSEGYRTAVSAFYAGFAAMEVGADAHAEAKLLEVTQVAPAEPAAWANLGLLALRRSEFDAAAERLGRAQSLAPESGSIQMLLGLLAGERGRPEEAMAHLRRAVELEPANPRAIFALVRELERAGGGHEAEIEEALEGILAIDPGNSAVWVERLRLAVRSGDVAAAARAVEALRATSGPWTPEARARLDALEESLSRSDLREAATRAAFLRNVLLRVRSFREDLAAVEPPQDPAGAAMGAFLRLPMPSAALAPPDDSLRFAVEPLSVAEEPRAEWLGVIVLEEGEPEIWVADGRRARTSATSLPFPGGAAGAPPMRDGITAVDFDNDFRVDLAMAGAGGFRLYRREEGDRLEDVTGQLTLPERVVNARYTGVWAADLDLEGDLDLVLGAPTGPPRALRNNGDGTFQAIAIFEGVSGLRGFAAADIDGDGDPDVALLDGGGRVRVWLNERGGRFLEWSFALEPAGVLALALAAADVEGDGVLDLLWLGADGVVRGLVGSPHGGGVGGATVRELARWPQWPGGVEPGRANLEVADLDNNGGLDLVVTVPGESRAWLRGPRGALRPLADPLEAAISTAVDVNGDGRLDLVGLAANGRPVALINRGERPYRWTRLRPRAAQVEGDQRINSFGVGGEIEVRAGLLYQKQPIRGPVAHFGLGRHAKADVARILWPNGVAQAEFDLPPDRAVVALQRLKGSCPWVFTYDGTRMRFVTDFLWRSPLGMRVNAVETAGVATTEDRVKIRGDQLVARDGFYEVRITAELWETHFFDRVSLVAVDHPAGSEIFVDERFAFPPPSLEARVTGPLRPIAAAWDDRGADVTDRVRALDERYLDGFELGRYQGVARDHYVEIDLGDDVPRESPVWLVASGWTRPTDSSINVALSQGAGPPPQGLRLEVPDGRGGWVVAREDLGFPAGKSKTILIEIGELLGPKAPPRVRLATNLEVYWDRIAWAVGRSDEPLSQPLLPAHAELRHRGFSKVSVADRSSPEYPVYGELAGTAPVWRDLSGYYTRHGDVRPLLERVDDRYVIMNAGDELVLRFPAPAGPPDGWTRDFVLIGDGWVKDGDYNTSFSSTVRPLPSHDRSEYTTPPLPLEQDPVYRRHPEDWRVYHTRYVAPQRFRSALASRP